MESKTVEEICAILTRNGFCSEIVERFREEEMDGAALSTAFATSPGPDCLKEIVLRCGPRLKVYNFLKKMIETYQTSESACSDSGAEDSYTPTPSPSVASSRRSSVDITLQASQKRDDGQCSSGSRKKNLEVETTPSRATPVHQKDKAAKLPYPFETPPFRQSTINNFTKKVLVDLDRKYVVQTIATHVMGHVERPSLNCCSIAAKSLVNKYPFLKDAHGDGEHSWKWYIYNRCQNVNRKSHEDGATPRKYIKLEDKRKHAYPPVPTHADDSVSIERNMSLLQEEFQKPSGSQRPEVIKSLMAKTFTERRKRILEASSVKDTIELFPVLKKSTYAALEFATIIQKNDIRENFDDNLLDWCKAVIKHCKETQTRNSVLRGIVSQYSVDDCLPASIVTLGLQCLYLLFTSSKDSGKHLCTNQSIPFIMSTVPRGTPPTEAPQKSNNQPHIVVFHDLDDEELGAQYFIAIEQTLMLESSNIFGAVFYWMASHYIFNLQYHQKVVSVLLFLQEKIFSLPSNNVRRTPTFMTHLSGICRAKDDLTLETSEEVDEMESVTELN